MVKRIEAIVAFMERIAPSERGAIGAVEGPDAGGPPAIIWSLLPENVVRARMLITLEGGLFTAVIHLGDVDRVTDPIRVATAIHTDDEIARKILVFGADFLDDLRSGAIENDAFEEAKAITRYRGLIIDGLQAWGAGTTSRYERPGPQPSSSAMGAAFRASGPVALAPEVEQRRRVRNHTIFWLVVNIVMIGVAGTVSLVTYRSASTNGGAYYVWWGPLFWGIINVARFADRLTNMRDEGNQDATS